MYQATINDRLTVEIDPKNVFSDADVVEYRPNSFHLLCDVGKSHCAEVVLVDKENKTVRVQVNGHNYTVSLKDKTDLLLEKMGIGNALKAKVNELKAPMPGLVLDVRVSAGDVVSRGDVLLVLEAMKMENVLKSPVDGQIKDVAAVRGMAVEKGQVLLRFG